jgi:hypothetical protein
VARAAQKAFLRRALVARVLLEDDGVDARGEQRLRRAVRHVAGEARGPVAELVLELLLGQPVLAGLREHGVEGREGVRARAQEGRPEGAAHLLA